MACTPRLWQVLMSSFTYASIKGTVMVTDERSGSMKLGFWRKRLMVLKM